MKRPLAAVLAVGLLAACGSPAIDTGPAPSADDTTSGGGRHEGIGLVLDKKGRGPELCLGGADDSLPPQCRGVPLIGWDWDAVQAEESTAGVTWGDYHVIGRYDGKTLTVLEAPPPSSRTAMKTSSPRPVGNPRVAGPSRTPQGPLSRTG